MEVELLFVSLAIALAHITPSNAQSISPAGHYSKKTGGAGEMRVENQKAVGVFLSTQPGHRGARRAAQRPQIVG